MLGGQGGVKETTLTAIVRLMCRAKRNKSGSYGPYGPFRFLGKNEIRYGNFHQNLTFLEKPNFPDYLENELILLGLFSQRTPFLDPYPAPFSDPLKN